MASQVLKIMGLAFLLATGLLLVILSGALYSNWNPLLVLIFFFLAPLPNILATRGCCTGEGEDFLSSSETTPAQDAAYFMTAMLVVSGFGVVIVLAHVGIVGIPAMVLSLLGGLMIYGTIVGYAWIFSSDDESSW